MTTPKEETMGPLFDALYQAHSETSQEAAEVIEPHAFTLRHRVHKHLRGKGTEGATDEEIQEALSMDPSTQRPRRIELVRAGLVIDSGLTRKTRSGRAATVWRIKP